MSRHRARRVDRSAAEQLLAGARPADAEPLAALLRAAAAPVHPTELAGEQAALAAFRAAAALEAAPEPRRPSTLRSVLAKLLTVKAVLVLAAVGSTGVVLAAGSGAMPVPWSATPADPTAATRTTSAPVSTRAPVTRTSPASPSTGTASTPAPSMTGLCRAYLAQANQNPGGAGGNPGGNPGSNPGSNPAANPAFTALVTAAGGAENVPEFCTDLAAEQPHGRPSDLPTPTNSTDPPGNSDDPPGSRPATPPGRTQTPGSPAPGAETAVTPSGARTPSRGG